MLLEAMDGLLGQLNAVFLGQFVATRDYVAPSSPDLSVTFIPQEIAIDPVLFAQYRQRDVTFYVVVRQPISMLTNDAIDPLLTLPAEIERFFRFRAPPGLEAVCLSTRQWIGVGNGVLTVTIGVRYRCTDIVITVPVVDARGDKITDSLGRVITAPIKESVPCEE